MAVLERQGKRKLAIGTVVTVRSVPKDMLPQGAVLRPAGHDAATGKPLWMVQRAGAPKSRGEKSDTTSSYSPSAYTPSSSSSTPSAAAAPPPEKKKPADYTAACEIYRWDNTSKLEKEFQIRDELKRLQTRAARRAAQG